ncbi:hypothetical protein GCM10009716_00170 [Streptomyces sodiiphilus]|uniref:Transposase DDE domain-containing protein n=1 Tax=Streptomyces sodiiphilus TaxID=226217 RepID=A0ABN2NRS5_9ACTN
MKSSHTATATFAAADDSNLIAYGGLAAGVRLAERCGLPRLVRDKLSLAGAANGAGTAADAKVMSLVAGMLAGAGSIDDVDVLRHGAMPRAFSGIRAPPPWARSCAPSPGATCVNWSPSPGHSRRTWSSTAVC